MFYLGPFNQMQFEKMESLQQGLNSSFYKLKKVLCVMQMPLMQLKLRFDFPTGKGVCSNNLGFYSLIHFK